MKSNVLGRLTFLQFKLKYKKIKYVLFCTLVRRCVLNSKKKLVAGIADYGRLSFCKLQQGLPDSDVLQVTIDPRHEDVLHNYGLPIV